MQHARFRLASLHLVDRANHGHLSASTYPCLGAYGLTRPWLRERRLSRVVVRQESTATAGKEGGELETASYVTLNAETDTKLGHGLDKKVATEIPRQGYTQVGAQKLEKEAFQHTGNIQERKSSLHDLENAAPSSASCDEGNIVTAYEDRTLLPFMRKVHKPQRPENIDKFSDLQTRYAAVPKSVARQYNDLHESSTFEVYQKLRKGFVNYAQLWAAYLIRHRGEKPNKEIYKGLLRMQSHNNYGSTDRIGSLLKEMQAEGIEPDAELCHLVLKALAVHPHHLLREQLLEYMRMGWIQLTDEGRHHLIAGHLRAGQFETGLDILYEMVNSGIQVQGWLFDLAMHMLLEAEEVDEVIRLADKRVHTQQQEIDGSLWFRMLDKAISTSNYAATLFVWNRRVVPEYLNPSSGQCLQALQIAARNRDITLATDVFRVLARRNTVFTIVHYELLVNAYVAARDTNGTFKLLCLMAELGMQVDQASTRKLFRLLAGSVHSWTREEAYKSLLDLKRLHPIPPSALNVLIEATAVHNLEAAMGHYKEFNNICGVNPNLETINMLLKQCVQKKDKTVAMFLAAELVALEIRPDALTYDRIMLVCTWCDAIDDAFGYLFEMQQQNLKPRLGTVFALGKFAAIAGDPRTPKLLEYLSTLPEGLQPAVLLQSVYAKALEGDLRKENKEEMEVASAKEFFQ